MKRITGVLCWLTVVPLSTLAAGTSFFWHGGAWGDYGDPANWTVGDPVAPATDTSANPASIIPGADDWLYPKYQNNSAKFDLGGEVRLIQSISTDGKNNYPNDVTTTTFALTNGTLKAVHLSGRRQSWTVWNGADYDVTTADSESTLGWGGGEPTINIKSGGRFTLNAVWLRNQSSQLTVDEGGYACINLNKGHAAIHRGVGNTTYSRWQNSGTLELPQGLVFYSTQSGSEREWGKTSWRLVQHKGTMLIGGNVTRNGKTTYPINFTALGGMVVFSNSVSFADSGYACVSNTVTFECVKDAVGDLTGFAFGDDATVVKTGPGRLLLTEMPPTLEVEAGEVAFKSVFSGCPIALAADVRVVFATKDFSTVTATDLTGWADADFAIEPGVFETGDTVVASGDADLLARVADRVNENLPAGAPFAAVATNGRVRLMAGADAFFDATKSGDLTDAGAWGGTVPPASATVAISGAGKVGFTAASTPFAKIIVRSGATLEVSGGTEEEPVDLPDVLLEDSGTLRIAEDAWVKIEKGFSSSGLRETLPVFEVATGAVAKVGWIAATSAQPAVARFKNVDIRHYGTIRVSVSSSSWGQVTIGYATPSETSLIAYRCEGGRFYRDRGSSSTADWGGTAGRVNFLCPEAGGRVQAVGDIVLRDYQSMPRSNISNYGYNIGLGNPIDEPFTVVCSGTTLLEPNGPTVFGGAAELTFRDSAALTRTPSMHHPNCPSCVHFTERATAVFEAGTYYHLFYSHPNDWMKANQVGSRLLTGEDGFVSLTFRNARASTIQNGGTSNAVVRMENSAFEVGYKHPIGNGSTPAPNTVDISMFDGAKAIDVPAGSLLTVRATSESSYSSFSVGNYQWDRRLYLDRPLTGGGDVSVSNILTGTFAKYDMCLAIRCGSNELTGEIEAQDNVLAHVVFQDGANWAGTVVANGRVSLSKDVTVTNETEIATLGAAEVSFNTIRFAGAFPIRVWETDGVKTCDVVNLAAATSGTGGFEILPQDGYEPQIGDTFRLGTYPADAVLPPVRTRHWRIEAEAIDGDEAHVALKLVHFIPGMILFVR